jgi:hypothetical protein
MNTSSHWNFYYGSILVWCIILYDNRIASNYVMGIIIQCIKYGLYIYTHMYLGCVECNTGMLAFVKIYKILKYLKLFKSY